MKNGGVTEQRNFCCGKTAHSTTRHRNECWNSASAFWSFSFRSSLDNISINISVKYQDATMKNGGVTEQRNFCCGKTAHSTTHHRNECWNSAFMFRSFSFPLSLDIVIMNMSVKYQDATMKNGGVTEQRNFCYEHCSSTNLVSFTTDNDGGGWWDGDGVPHHKKTWHKKTNKTTGKIANTVHVTNYHEHRRHLICGLFIIRCSSLSASI